MWWLNDSINDLFWSYYFDFFYRIVYDIVNILYSNSEIFIIQLHITKFESENTRIWIMAIINNQPLSQTTLAHTENSTQDNRKFTQRSNDPINTKKP